LTYTGLMRIGFGYVPELIRDYLAKSTIIVNQKLILLRFIHGQNKILSSWTKVNKVSQNSIRGSRLIK